MTLVAAGRQIISDALNVGPVEIASRIGCC